MKTLNNDTYYKILEVCSLEAFECLKTIDYFPKNGTKQYSNASTLTINNNNGAIGASDNELYSKSYILEDIRVRFLKAIDRYRLKYKNKYLIDKEFFYKNCIQSFLEKRMQNPSPILKFDYTNPSVLSFIQSMQYDIINRSGQNIIGNTAIQTDTVILKVNNVKEETNEFIKSNVSDLMQRPKKDYKKYIWFTTGLTLATGEAFSLYHKYKNDKGQFTKICLKLGFKESDRPYFSATIQNNISDKNTFANKDKLQKLHKHLTENNLPFGAVFLKKYNAIEPE